MTAKRFTKVSSNGYWSIKDNQADYKKIWDLTNPQLIEDRLNELNDEVEVCKQAYDEIKSDAINLKKENEELKTQLQNTSDQRDEFYRGAKENTLRVGKLEKENKQLKNICKNLINEINNKGITVTMTDNVKELLE